LFNCHVPALPCVVKAAKPRNEFLVGNTMMTRVDANRKAGFVNTHGKKTHPVSGAGRDWPTLSCLRVRPEETHEPAYQERTGTTVLGVLECEFGLIQVFARLEGVELDLKFAVGGQFGLKIPFHGFVRMESPFEEIGERNRQAPQQLLIQAIELDLIAGPEDLVVVIEYDEDTESFAGFDLQREAEGMYRSEARQADSLDDPLMILGKGQRNQRTHGRLLAYL